MPPRKSIAKNEDSSKKARGSKAAKGGKVKEEPVMGLSQPVDVKNKDTWSRAQKQVEELSTRDQRGGSDEIQRADEIKKYLIGYALLRFAGTNDVHGIVDLDEDPNRRYNPRPLDDSHVNRLAELFASGGKKDRISPIRISLPLDLLEDSLVTKMRKARPSDPNSPVPQLVIKRPQAERELTLESQHWLRSDGKRLLSDNELEEIKRELFQLRADRPRAKLLNGNHRTRAMAEASAHLRAAQMHIVQQEREGADADTIEEKMKALNVEVEKATYVVEVYQHPLPAHVAAWLSENDAERPNYAPRPGEKLWSLVEAQEGMVVKMIATHEAVDRIEALNLLNEIREMDASAREMTMAQASKFGTPDRNAAGNGQKTKVHGVLSDQACRELLSYPTTMEMAVDTRAALWCYNNRLNDTHVTQMRRDGGAVFVAHFWLSLRLLIKLTNVSNGSGLEAAEAYLNRVREIRLPADGDTEAMQFWDDLHKDGQAVPTLLSQYEGTASQQFEKILREEMDKIQFVFGKGSYDGIEYINAMRTVYTRFGDIFASQKGDHARRLSASIRLYARLPTWKVGAGENYFFPAAILPARTCLTALAN